MPEVAAQHAEGEIGPVGGEHLTVPGVVTEEAELAEDHGQEPGQAQLPPGIADQSNPGQPMASAAAVKTILDQ